jgi:Icc protein
LEWKFKVRIEGVEAVENRSLKPFNPFNSFNFLIMNRRHFVQNLSTLALLLNGKSIMGSELPFMGNAKPMLRFVIASDFHYGQPKTEYATMTDTALNHIKQMHTENAFDFGVLNGDLVHDNISYFGEFKNKVDSLTFPYYVTQGNHDMATKEEWESAWQQPLNFEIKKGNTVLLFASTSNKKGEYLPPNMEWLTAKFREHEKAKHILLFIHIPPIKWTKNAIESTPFVELVKKQNNLRAVFHGHEHDQDGIKWNDGIPYLFDSHVGGNWGTSYKGFRIVELMKDGSILTWIMNPTEKINAAEIPAMKGTLNA